MPGNPNRFSIFWQELKRRKVIKVMAMYAATAFIIMEAGDIMLPRLGLPDWTVTFIIILLIVGFPITIILSWIFDVTPEGIKKTEPVKESREKVSEGKPDKRKVKVSDGIIAVLILVVCILLYPKIVLKDRLEGLRDGDGRISIVVMPFQNLTADSIYTDIGLGLQNLLITRLSNSKELSVRQSQTIGEILSNTESLNYASITPSFAREIAVKLDANTVVLGSIHKSGPDLRITANMMDSGSEEIYQSFEIDGHSDGDLFSITDSLTTLIRNHLEIKIMEEEMNKEIQSYAETGSTEAYKYFSKGLNKFWISDFEAASSLFETALVLDPDFFSASMWLIPTYTNMGKNIQGRLISDSLNNKLDNCTYEEQVTIKYWQNYFNRDPHESIKYAKLIVEENSMQRSWWFQLGNEYYRIKQYREAINAYEKALEIDRNWGGGWKWAWGYVALAEVYHFTGQHNRENEIYELGLIALPDHPLILVRQAACKFFQEDTAAANVLISKYRTVCKQKGYSVSRIEDDLGYSHEIFGNPEEAMKHYRQSIGSEPSDIYTIWAMNGLARLLIQNDIDLNEGLLLIDQALKTDPTDEELLAGIYYTKGIGLHKQGKNGEALEYLRKALYLGGEYEYDHLLQIRELEKTLAGQNP